MEEAAKKQKMFRYAEITFKGQLTGMTPEDECELQSIEEELMMCHDDIMSAVADMLDKKRGH